MKIIIIIIIIKFEFKTNNSIINSIKSVNKQLPRIN
jgi:hypothetical protein